MPSYHIDLKYAGILSSRLPNHKQFKPGFFVFSHDCESTQGKRKTRGYIYPKGTGLNVFCHHCQYSASLGSFIKLTDPYLYDEYRLENYRESTLVAEPFHEPKPVVAKRIDTSHLEFLSTLSSKHPAVQYVQKRKIPEQFFDKIAFVKDFNRFASEIDETFKDKGRGVPRLIFPFYDASGKVISYSARCFGKEIPKYIKLILDTSVENIYGLWRVDLQKPILVVEGQIDSLFLENSVAVGGADYSKKFLVQNKENVIICPDSDFERNPQVAASVKKAIDAGFAVSFLPKEIPFKDINDAVVKGGVSGTSLSKVLVASRKSGAAAMLEFIFRKKC